MHRFTRGVLVTAALLLPGLLAACAPPATQPGPTVLPRPEGRGKVAGMEVAPSAACGSSAVTPSATASAGRTLVQIPWQGGSRAAYLDLPTGDGGTPRPVLVSLHPFALGPLPWDDYSGLAAAATARGYAVLTPLGSEPGPRWAVPGGLLSEADDIGFVSALLDHLEDTVCVDRNREFAAGFSAGAAMAQALSCTLPWRMAGVAGSGGTNLTDLCPGSPGTDVFVLHGTADPIAPITGSNVVFAPPLDLPVSDVVATDAARAGCDPTPVTTQLYPTVSAETYQGCTDGRRVQYWKMQGSGHTWAGTAPSVIEIVGGPTNQDFSATDAVLDHFDAHTG